MNAPTPAPPAAVDLAALPDGVCALARADAEGLWLYRDASGLQPLYWCAPPGAAPRHATRLAGLLPAVAGADGRARLHRPALHEYLRLLDVAGPHTFVAGVQAVEPGHWLRVDADGRVRSGRVPPAPVPACARYEDALDAVGQALAASVGAALHGAARPAVLLSGGVDSALLAATAAAQRPDLVAVTVGFDDAAHDEAGVAARIAAHLGLRHAVLRFGRHELLAAFDRLARGMDQPMADPATLATVLAFDHCRARHDLVLDGTGADEALGALPPRHLRRAVAIGLRWPAALRRAAARALAAVPALRADAATLDFEHPADVLTRWHGWRRSEIEALCGEPVSLAHTRLYRSFEGHAPGAHFERYSALLDAMPCERLVQATQVSALEPRYPYAARAVDALLRSLPQDWRHAPGQPKRILRELLARCVPRALWDAPKHGFNFPLHDFLAADGHALVHRHVLEGRWLARGLLHAEVARDRARRYLGGERQSMFRVWALVVLGAWLDAHENLY